MAVSTCLHLLNDTQVFLAPLVTNMYSPGYQVADERLPAGCLYSPPFSYLAMHNRQNSKHFRPPRSQFAVRPHQVLDFIRLALQ